MLNNDHINLIYSISNYSDDYKSLDKFYFYMDKIKILNTTILTFKLLMYLNTYYGFIHGNLIAKNIFVKIGSNSNVNIKLCDFTESSTINNPSDNLNKPLFKFWFYDLAYFMSNVCDLYVDNYIKLNDIYIGRTKFILLCRDIIEKISKTNEDIPKNYEIDYFEEIKKKLIT